MEGASQTKPYVLGRFAPTPSGRMHLGNVFSCLMAWLAARSAGGRMVLRVEDLDPRAHDAHAAQLLVEDLAWLGLDWDEGPFFQSDRREMYRTALEHLDRDGIVYPCFCTRADLHAASAPHASDGTYVYQGTCRRLTQAEIELRGKTRDPALRVAVPMAYDLEGTIDFVDRVYGRRREILAKDCGDFIVRRSDGVIAYQLAVVVDDTDMGVTQVVRGRDLLGSSARQIWLARRLGKTPPEFAHIPLLVSPDGRRLSKRDRDLDIGLLREQGYTASQIVSALANAVGLASSNERIEAKRLVERFTWDALREHPDDIIVDDMFFV